MNAATCLFAAVGATTQQSQMGYIWSSATIEAKVIIVCLVIFSIFAWGVMVSKAIQMRRAKKLNLFFDTEFRSQRNVLGIFDRRVQVEGCPLFTVYQDGCIELDARLRGPDGETRRKNLSLKGAEHVKRILENAVARESIKLESGLILL